jgi:hypothetical protein
MPTDELNQLPIPAFIPARRLHCPCPRSCAVLPTCELDEASPHFDPAPSPPTPRSPHTPSPVSTLSPYCHQPASAPVPVPRRPKSPGSRPRPFTNDPFLDREGAWSAAGGRSQPHRQAKTGVNARFIAPSTPQSTPEARPEVQSADMAASSVSWRVAVKRAKRATPLGVDGRPTRRFNARLVGIDGHLSRPPQSSRPSDSICPAAFIWTSVRRCLDGGRWASDGP